MGFNEGFFDGLTVGTIELGYIDGFNDGFPVGIADGLLVGLEGALDG